MVSNLLLLLLLRHDSSTRLNDPCQPSDSVVPLMHVVVSCDSISLHHSTNQPNVLWPSWKRRAGICFDGHRGKKGLLCLQYVAYVLKFHTVLLCDCQNVTVFS